MLSEEEIIEANRMLAKIDGYREVAVWNGYNYGYFHHPTINMAGIADVDLDYHTNWNSLIRLIRKFNKLGKTKYAQIEWDACLIEKSLTETYDIKKVYPRVIRAWKRYLEATSEKTTKKKGRR